MLLPRTVVFDEFGKAITAGIACDHYPDNKHPNVTKTVMHLKSEHHDFIDTDVRGKTKERIESENSN